MTVKATATATRTPAAPRQPGPLARKTRETVENLARVAGPYLAALLVAVLAAWITGEGWILVLVLGAALWHAVLRLHEDYGWHRQGGRAAARKRRKYQGPASRREIRARLSLHAIRRRAHVTRPATSHPRRLPAEELGVLIGETVRRSR